MVDLFFADFMEGTEVRNSCRLFLGQQNKLIIKKEIIIEYLSLSLSQSFKKLIMKSLGLFKYGFSSCLYVLCMS